MEFRSDCTPWIARNAIDWQPADMTAIVGADLPWSDLSHDSLWLPIDCQGRTTAALSQLAEQNSTGPLRIGFGAWRDLLLGCQFHNGRGQLITVGGRTVKNVAGYDLTKFLIGQRGVFGKISALALRAYPKPDAALLADFPPDISLFNRLLISPQRPHWAILTEHSLACGYVADQRTIDYQSGQLPAFNPRRLDRHSFAADQDYRAAHWRIPEGTNSPLRASIPPARILDFARQANLNNWIADPAFGILLARGSTDAAPIAESFGGRAWFSNDGGELTAFPATPAEREILRRLKQSLDPENQLAPLP